MSATYLSNSYFSNVILESSLDVKSGVMQLCLKHIAEDFINDVSKTIIISEAKSKQPNLTALKKKLFRTGLFLSEAAQYELFENMLLNETFTSKLKAIGGKVMDKTLDVAANVATKVTKATDAAAGPLKLLQTVATGVEHAVSKTAIGAKVVGAVKAAVKWTWEKLKDLGKWVIEKVDPIFKATAAVLMGILKGDLGFDRNVPKELTTFCKANKVIAPKGKKIRIKAEQLKLRIMAFDNWPVKEMFSISENMQKQLGNDFGEKLKEKLKKEISKPAFKTLELDDKGELLSIDNKAVPPSMSDKLGELKEKIMGARGFLGILVDLGFKKSDPEIDDMLTSVIKTLRDNSMSIGLASASIIFFPPAGAFAWWKLIVSAVVPVLFDFGIMYYKKQGELGKKNIDNIMKIKVAFKNVMTIINMFHAAYKLSDKIINDAEKALADNLSQIKDEATKTQMGGILQRGLDSSKALTPAESKAIMDTVASEVNGNPPGGPMTDMLNSMPFDKTLSPAMSRALLAKMVADPASTTDFFDNMEQLKVLSDDDAKELVKKISAIDKEIGQNLQARLNYLSGTDYEGEHLSPSDKIDAKYYTVNDAVENNDYTDFDGIDEPVPGAPLSAPPGATKAGFGGGDTGASEEAFGGEVSPEQNSKLMKMSADAKKINDGYAEQDAKNDKIMKAYKQMKDEKLAAAGKDIPKPTATTPIVPEKGAPTNNWFKMSNKEKMLDMQKQIKDAGLDPKKQYSFVGGKLLNPNTGPTEYQKGVMKLSDSMKQSAVAGKTAANKLMAAGARTTNVDEEAF